MPEHIIDLSRDAIIKRERNKPGKARRKDVVLPGQFDVIALDPPWYYNQRCAHQKDNPGKRTRFGGGAHAEYPLMRDEDLLDLKDLIQAVMAPNCLVYMWETGPRADFAKDLARYWGLRYITRGFTWIKMTDAMDRPNHGPGGHTASNSEDMDVYSDEDADDEIVQNMIITGRGALPPDERMVPSVVFTPRMKHSKKPEEVYRRLERMYRNIRLPDGSERPGRLLELFAREERRGWVTLGNEVGDCLDIRDALELAATGYYDLEFDEDGLVIDPNARTDDTDGFELVG